MKHVRLSIGGLMIAVSFIAVGVAALRGMSAAWACATFAIAAASCLGAVLGIFARRGAARLPFAGFALFGWAYLIFIFGPFSEINGAKIPPSPALISYELLQKLLIPQGYISVDGANYRRVATTDLPPPPESIFEESSSSVHFFAPDKVPAGWTVVKSAPEGPGSMMSGAFGPDEMADRDGIRVGVSPGNPPPPGMVAARPPLVDLVQLRRIIHSLGTIAFGLVGAGIGWAVTARLATEHRASTN
jgi:hypothetical protein